MKIALPFATVVLGVLMTASPAVTAVDATEIDVSDPVELLRDATEQTLALTAEARGYASEDPERYYSEIEAIVDRIVDVDYFTRGVMGTYASMRLYQSLESEEEKAAFRRRIDRFAEQMKRSFIETYGDALLGFEADEIDVNNPSTGDISGDDASLVQTIRGPDNQSYAVRYRLHKGRDGAWRVFNVVVEGLNLGQIYRTQFAEAVDSNGGDVDYVVENWPRLMAGREPLTEAEEETAE